MYYYKKSDETLHFPPLFPWFLRKAKPHSLDRADAIFRASQVSKRLFGHA